MDSTMTPRSMVPPHAEPRRRTGWFAGRQGRHLREALLAYLFLLPAFVIVGTFGLFPLLFAAYQSTLRGINQVVGRFDGLGNYVTAIDSLTYLLGFWGAVGLVGYAILRVVRAQRAAAERREPFWLWALPGLLIGACVAFSLGWIIRLLPGFLAIPERLRGSQATAANFRRAAWQAFLDPQVQLFFWLGAAALLLGVVVSTLITRRLAAGPTSDQRSLVANHTGVFAAATVLLALAAGLGYLTWDELQRALADAVEAGEPLGLVPQLVTMSAGVLLLALSWLLWRSAEGRSSNWNTGLRLAGAVVLIVGAWVLMAELPLAIARGDPLWWDGLLATIYYSIGTIPPQLLIALGLAALLFQNIRGRGVFRMLYFLPYIAPFVGTAAVFRILFSARPSAPVNAVLRFFGGDGAQWLAEPRGIFEMVAPWLPDWAGGPSLALVVIMIFGVWTFFGFNTVIFLAGLGSIPRETYEAAAIDGASRWAQFRHITLPLLSPTIYFLTLYSVIGTFKAFNHIYVLRTGAALGTTDTASVAIFQTFKRDLRFGYASALAILLLLIILVLTAVNNRIASKRVFYG